jgi:hypothetical protein
MQDNKIKKINLIKKSKKCFLNQPELTWLTCYLRYKIKITQQNNGTSNETKSIITKSMIIT